MPGENQYVLHEAARDGKVLMVKGLVSEAPKSVLVRDIDGRTPLHWAVAFGHVEIASILLYPWKFAKEGEGSSNKFEIDLDDYADDSGWTPLHIASSVGNLEIVQLLLNYEPTPDVQLTTGNGSTCTHLACSKKHLDVLKELVQNKASVRRSDDKKQLPIHKAASVGSTGIVEYLVKEAKSPINAIDRDGWTPMHHALAEGFGDVAALLVKLGADYNIEDHEGLKPVDVAVDEKVQKYFKSVITE